LRIDNTTLSPNAVLGTHPWDSVETDIDFTQAVADNAWKQPLFAYPFDKWSVSITLALASREEAIAANLSNGFAYPLIDASLSDSTCEFIHFSFILFNIQDLHSNLYSELEIFHQC
jgi:hypothetical protein